MGRGQKGDKDNVQRDIEEDKVEHELSERQGVGISILKYDDPKLEISFHEYSPPIPYYQFKNNKFFTSEFTASSLVAHNGNRHQHHHHHPHHNDSGGGEESTTDKKTKEMLEVLEFYLPFRDFKDENGKYYRQKVSSQPMEPSDVQILTEEFENQLDERHAKESGYCPIRRELFNECFDEILRQVIVTNPVTGVLLARVRDEIRMTIGCYRFLNQSMDAFGSKKSIQSESYQNESDRLNGLKEDLDIKTLIELRNKRSILMFEQQKQTIRFLKKHEVDLQKRKEDVEFVKKVGNQLSQQLERFTSRSKY